MVGLDLFPANRVASSVQHTADNGGGIKAEADSGRRFLEFARALNTDAGFHQGAAMAMTQLLIRLPDELAMRFKRNVSVRQRSGFIQRLLEQARPPDDGGDDPLYQAALAVERESGLSAEMAEWEVATLADGLGPAEPRAERR